MKTILVLLTLFISISSIMYGDDADAYFQQGKNAYSEKDYERAFMFFQKACDLSPETAKYQYNLGLAARKTNKYTVAFKAFEEARRLDPQISFTNDKEGFKEKLEEMRRLTDSVNQQDDAYTYFNDGEEAYRAQNFERAFSLFSKAVSIQPKSAKYQYNLGLAARKLGTYSIARDAFLEAKRLDPDITFTTKKDDFFDKLEEVTRRAGGEREETRPVSKKKQVSPALIVIIIIGLIVLGIFIMNIIKKRKSGGGSTTTTTSTVIHDDYDDYRSYGTKAGGRRKPRTSRRYDQS
jgi:tetratricopeptide (TPR) repeat protein